MQSVKDEFNGILTETSFVSRINTEALFKLVLESFNLFNFYPRDAMLARVIEIATCLSVCLSVCPCVRPSRAGIVSKRRKLAS